MPNDPLIRPAFITEEEARAMLTALCRQYGAARKLARHTNLYPSHISNMLAGRTTINRQVAEILGLVPVTGFINAEPLPNEEPPS